MICAVVGIITGYLYGLSFIGKARIISFAGIPIAQMSIVRITIFSLILYVLLLSHNVHFILFLVSFLSAFWCVIIKAKGR